MADAIIRVSHLEKSFGKHKVLKDINFDVNKGDVTCIIGSSGSGKSTLLRCINVLEIPTAGNIYFHDKDILDKSNKVTEYRAKVGMVFQSFNLFNNMTVLQNCTVGVRKVLKKGDAYAKEIATKYLEKVGMLPYINAKPSQLSGGQKQRVAIARALTTDPKVLLCDEATSALDPKITEEILNLLKKINRDMGLTVVIITHEMSVVEKICDRVAIIDHGTLAEIGDVKRIFTAPESEAAKRLVFPVNQTVNPFDGSGSRCIRIAFDGRSANEPVIADLVEKTGEKVSILCANTRSVGGIGFGQMIIALPETAEGQQKVLDYFSSIGLAVSEVTGEEEA